MKISAKRIALLVPVLIVILMLSSNGAISSPGDGGGTTPTAGPHRTQLLDDFNRADGAPGANWSNFWWYGQPAISGNEIDFAHQWKAIRWDSGSEIGPNSEAWMKVDDLWGAQKLILRASADGDGHYSFYDVAIWDDGSGGIGKVVDSAARVDVGDGFPSGTVQAGDYIAVSAVDDTIEVWRWASGGTEWTLVSSATDSDITGQGSIAVTGMGMIDAFGGGTITPPPANQPPQADASPDQTITIGQTAQLDGSGSSDPDGDTLSYEWTQTVGPSVDLSSPSAAKPTFAPPSNSTTLVFRLTVSDGTATSTDSVTITVTSQAGTYTQTVNVPWYLDVIDQRFTENSYLPNYQYQYNYTNERVRVYVVDTGINVNHSQFQRTDSNGDIVRNASYGYDPVTGYDYKTNPGAAPPSDCSGHGTEIASIIGGKDYGVAKNAEIIAVRASAPTDCRGGAEANVTAREAIDAIHWIRTTERNRYPDTPLIVNFSSIYYCDSHGCSDNTADILALVQEIRDAITEDDITFTICSGNGVGGGIAQKVNLFSVSHSPSNAPDNVDEAIIVGATNAANRRASYSNYGQALDVHAPGGEWFNGEPIPPQDGMLAAGMNGNEVVVQGTSYSAPIAAGLAALYLENHPKAKPADVESALVNTATSDVLKNSDGTSLDVDTANRFVYSWLSTSPTPGLSREPSVDGTAKDTFLLSTDGGEWTRESSVRSYVWLRCDNNGGGCSPILAPDGGYYRGNTYRLKQSDIDHRVKVRVTATNTGGTTVVDSLLTDVVAPAISRLVIHRNDVTLTYEGGVWSGAFPANLASEWSWSEYAGGETGHGVCPDYPNGDWHSVGATPPTLTISSSPCWGVTVKATDPASGELITEAASDSFQLAFAQPVNTSPPWITRSGNALTAQDGGWVTDGPVTTTYVWHWNSYTVITDHGAYCGPSYPGTGGWHDATATTERTRVLTSADAGKYCWAVTVYKDNSGGLGAGESGVFTTPFNAPTPQSAPTISRSGMTLSVTGGNWSEVPDSIVTSYQWKSNSDASCPAYPNGSWANSGTSTSVTMTAARHCWVVIETKTNPISGEHNDATSAVFGLPAPIGTRSTPNGSMPTLSVNASVWAGGNTTGVTYKWYWSEYAGGSYGYPVCPTFEEGTWNLAGTSATQVTSDSRHCWVAVLRKTDPATQEYVEGASGVYQLTFVGPTVTAGWQPPITRNGSTLGTGDSGFTINDPVTTTYSWHWSYYTESSNGHPYCTSSYPGSGTWQDITTSGPSVPITNNGQTCWAVTVLKENSGGGAVATSTVLPVTFTLPAPISAPTISRSGMSLSAVAGSWTVIPDALDTTYRWYTSDYAGYTNGTPYCPAFSGSWTFVAAGTGVTAAGAQHCWVVVERKTNPILGQYVDAPSAAYRIAYPMPTLVSAPTVSRSSPNGSLPTLSTNGGVWSGGDPVTTSYQWKVSDYAGSQNGYPYCAAYPSGSWTNSGTGTSQTTTDAQHCWVMVVRKTNTTSGEYREGASGVYQMVFQPPSIASNPTISKSGNTLSTNGGGWTVRDPITSTSYYWEWSPYAGSYNGHPYCYSYPSAGHWSYASNAGSVTKGANQPCWVITVTKGNSGGSASGTSSVFMAG